MKCLNYVSEENSRGCKIVNFSIPVQQLPKGILTNVEHYRLTNLSDMKVTRRSVGQFTVSLQKAILDNIVWCTNDTCHPIEFQHFHEIFPNFENPLILKELNERFHDSRVINRVIPQIIECLENIANIQKNLESEQFRGIRPLNSKLKKKFEKYYKFMEQDKFITMKTEILVSIKRNIDGIKASMYQKLKEYDNFDENFQEAVSSTVKSENETNSLNDDDSSFNATKEENSTEL